MAAYEIKEREYQALLTEYEDKQAAYRASKGIVIQGRNPRINQEIIRTELKKSCLSLIARQFDTERKGEIFFNAIAQREEMIRQESVVRTEVETTTITTPEPGKQVTVTTKTIGEEIKDLPTKILIPAIDLKEVEEESPIIQFLEQAFEWQQITYVLYPYFWGKLPEKWFDAQRYYDEADPLFGKFLQAGAARTLVAVRPGFEPAVSYYLRCRRPWSGGAAPTIDDPLYLAIHEELREQQDDLNGASPYGDPWEVVVPTSLVDLQADAELPAFDCNVEGKPVEVLELNPANASIVSEAWLDDPFIEVGFSAAVPTDLLSEPDSWIRLWSIRPAGDQPEHRLRRAKLVRNDSRLAATDYLSVAYDVDTSNDDMPVFLLQVRQPSASIKAGLLGRLLLRFEGTKVYAGTLENLWKNIEDYEEHFVPKAWFPDMPWKNSESELPSVEGDVLHAIFYGKQV